MDWREGIEGIAMTAETITRESDIRVAKAGDLSKAEWISNCDSLYSLSGEWMNVDESSM